jgi:hypothetical protein
MVKLRATEKNNLRLRLLLLATVVVLVVWLAYVGGVVDMLAAAMLVGLVVVLTLALWLMIRLSKPQTNQIMNQEPAKAEEAPQKPDEILPPDAAREWLDDFLVEQQKDV